MYSIFFLYFLSAECKIIFSKFTGYCNIKHEVCYEESQEFDFLYTHIKNEQKLWLFCRKVVSKKIKLCDISVEIGERMLIIFIYL